MLGGQNIPLGLGNLASQKMIKGQQLGQGIIALGDTVTPIGRIGEHCQYIGPAPWIVLQRISLQCRSDGILVGQTGRAEACAQGCR